MNKVLITGGTGYVGSRVAEFLHGKGVEVTVVDIVPPAERNIIFSDGIEFRQHDLRIADEARKALQGAETVLHLAADIGSLNYMYEHQAEIITNNAAIDAAVYAAVQAVGVQWIVYSSSSMVYQYAPKYPYTEEDIAGIRPPANVYGFSKLSGEYFCKSYAKQFGISYTILRYHNIYGPGEDSKGSTPGDIHVIPALLEKTLSGQYPIEILGDPQNTRPFTYVDDAVEATAKIVLRVLAKGKEVHNTDFNVGNDEYYTIHDLAKSIWQQYGDGRPFAYIIKDVPDVPVSRREVNIQKISTAIGWRPTTSLQKGLDITAQWIRERLKNH